MRWRGGSARNRWWSQGGVGGARRRQRGRRRAGQWITVDDGGGARLRLWFGGLVADDHRGGRGVVVQRGSEAAGAPPQQRVDDGRGQWGSAKTEPKDGVAEEELRRTEATRRARSRVRVVPSNAQSNQPQYPTLFYPTLPGQWDT
jgi:hypothetical protein